MLLGRRTEFKDDALLHGLPDQLDSIDHVLQHASASIIPTIVWRPRMCNQPSC